MNSEEFRETFLRTTEKGPPRPKLAGKMAENNAWDRNSRRGNLQPRAAGAREATPVEPAWSTGREGSAAPSEAKRKAGPSGQKEKQRKETESPEGARKAPEAGGQNMAHVGQPRGRREQGPEEGAQGQWRVDTKDLQEGWETIKEKERLVCAQRNPQKSWRLPRSGAAWRSTE